MKKITIIASALLLALGFSSCSKQLENPRKGANDFNTFYANATAADAEKLIAEVYKVYFSGPEEVQIQNFFEIISDDSDCGGGTYADNANRYRNADELTCQPSDWLFHGPRRGYSLYQALYVCIYHCNLILDKIPETNDADINRVKAEARFLRAVCLFEAMRVWHNPPFADHIYSSDDMYAPNGDPAEMIDWILSNLEEAAKNLPAKAGKGQQALLGGRATAGAAQAFYGKAATWYAAKYNQPEYAKKAIEPLKALIEGNKYGLIDNPADLFRVKSDFCDEYIFERNCAETSSDKALQNDNRQTWRSLRNDNIYIPSEIFAYGWGFCLPTQAYVDFMKSHDGENTPRFKAKLASYEDLLAMDYDSENKGILPGRAYPNVIGYFNATCLMWKADVYTETGGNIYSRANNPIIRYAEVLLMYAEAQVVANNDADGSGLRALNEVRSRAKLEPLNSINLQAVIDERRAELYCEGERWFDIDRFKLGADVLKDAGKKRYAFRGYKPGTTEYDIEVTDGEGHGWDDKYYDLPFGDNEIQANENLVQHKGW
ncbi:MAG: RagB/SusD family nutrient uptake outer membrane protein [Bacteroidales bacterium]|nr:RagB/SusD family nutrient uptake outer membrane protein [Candidatus Cryptobacteroides caccocaballi]